MPECSRCNREVVKGSKLCHVCIGKKRTGKNRLVTNGVPRGHCVWAGNSGATHIILDNGRRIPLATV